MLALLLRCYSNFLQGGGKRYKASEGFSTVVIYSVQNKLREKFTRIDIFTRGSK